MRQGEKKVCQRNAPSALRHGKWGRVVRGKRGKGKERKEKGKKEKQRIGGWHKIKIPARIFNMQFQIKESALLQPILLR
jgi:hypothetical protein